MIIYVFAFGIFLYFCYKQVTPSSPHSKLAIKIGGPVGYPVVGNAFEFIKNMNRLLATLSNWVDRFGDRVVFTLGPATVFLINDPNDIEKVCTSTEVIEKSEDYEPLKEWLGEGLVTSTGQQWAHRRKLITPCFHFSILEKYVSPINKHAEILVDILKKNYQGNPNFTDITQYISRCTLDIICETAMGIQINSQMESTCEYIEAAHQVGQLFQYRIIRPWLRPNFLWNLTSQRREEVKALKVIHSFTDQVIADRKLSMKCSSLTDDITKNEEASGKKRKPLLDLLLELQQADQQSISDKGIREETTTFIFAGHDTVSAATSFCLYFIGCHPNVHSKVHEELDAVFGSDLKKPVTSRDLKHLKYLKLCMKESLRLFPVGPIIGRKVNSFFRLDENTVVTPGVTLYMFPYKLHRNPKYYARPEDYIPERFDPENEEFGQNGLKSHFAYIPFSAGPRNCIGQKLAMMEAKIILATILRQFKVQSEKKLEEVEVLSELVLRAKGGLKIKMECR